MRAVCFVWTIEVLCARWSWKRSVTVVHRYVLSDARYGLPVLTGFGGLGTGGSFGGAAGIVDTPQMFRAPIA